ncbi:MAG: peptidylprolyl isomerase [Acetilactobacillus jinshanensis]
MKLRKKILIGAMGGLMCLSLAACGNQSVATTNGGKITRTSYYNNMKKTANGKQVLQQMILDKVFSKDYGKDVKASQVNAIMEQMKAQYGSEFSMLLQQQGMTTTQLKKSLRSKLLLRQAVKHNTDFTKSMLKKQFKSFEPKVTVDQILVTSQSKAQTIESKLKSGDSFTSLAKKYSKDPTSKNGGRLAPFDNTANLSPKFKKAAFNLHNGEYTKSPVKTQYGYQIIKMVNKPEKGTYKDNKSALEDQITDKEMKSATLMHKIVSKVLRNGNVNIQDNSLKNILADYMSPSN